jgi:hypothetical protein
VAHDFNNLLTAINGFANLAQAQLNTGDMVWEYVRQVASASERAAKLTSQLLAFSRNQLTSPTTLHLNDEIRRMEAMLRHLLREDVALSLELAGDIPAVRFDPGQFGQILLNLAVNAREAMNHGGSLTIRTAVEKRVWNDGRAGIADGIRLEVTDTGCGMSGEVKAKIFEPFFTTKSSGTGQGLSIVYGAVSRAGGEVEVASEPGRERPFAFCSRRRQPRRWKRRKRGLSGIQTRVAGTEPSCSWKITQLSASLRGRLCRAADMQSTRPRRPMMFGTSWGPTRLCGRTFWSRTSSCREQGGRNWREISGSVSPASRSCLSRVTPTEKAKGWPWTLRRPFCKSHFRQAPCCRKQDSFWGPRRTILVAADDDDSVGIYLRRLLIGAGYRSSKRGIVGEFSASLPAMRKRVYKGFCKRGSRGQTTIGEPNDNPKRVN